MDIQRFGIMPYLDVVCGDAYTRKLELTLFSGGAEWPVPEGVTAAVRYSRSDGHGGLYDTLPDGKAACAIDGNVVTAILAPQMLSAPGFVNFSVALIKEEQILGLFPVGINVEADPSMEANKGESYYNYPSIGAINEAIADLESRMGELEQGGSGITNEEKKVILTLFKNIAYTADMSAKIAELEALWSISYKVAYSLTGAAVSNDAARVAEGGKYTTTLTAEGGYTLTGATVKVTMGGVDITSTAYSGGVITIESVTGPVVISVVAREIPSYSVTNNLTGVTTNNSANKVSEGDNYAATLTVEDGYALNSLAITMGGVDITETVYHEDVIYISKVTGDIVITAIASEIPTTIYALPEETEFDGTFNIDTGIHLFDERKSFTIMFAFTSTSSSSNYGNVFSEVPSTATEACKNGYAFALKDNGRWRLACLNNYLTVIDAKAVTNAKVVITYDSSTKVETVYYLNGDTIETQTRSITVASLIGNTTTLKMGTGYAGTENVVIGTVHSFEVHSKVLGENKINGFMGVA